MSEKLFAIVFLLSVVYFTNGCPTGCSCTATDFTCSAIDISEIPNDLDGTLTKITIDGASIQHLNASSFNPYSSLTRIVIINSGILTISLDTFDNLADLDYLDIHKNELSAFDADWLANSKLLHLNISNNVLYTLEDTGRKVIKNLEYLDVSGNPLHCNCELKWLKNAISKLTYSNVVCASPDEIRGDEIQNIDNNKLICKPPVIIYSPDVTAHACTDITLTCIAEGDPTPSVSLLAPDGATKKAVEPDDYPLMNTTNAWELRDLQTSDEGIYLCTAINIREFVEWNITLTVLLPGVCPLSTTDTLSDITSSTKISTAPSTSDNPVNDKPADDDNGGGLPQWVFIAAGIGGGLFLLALTICICCAVAKCNQKKRRV